LGGKTITIIILHPLGISIGIGGEGDWSRGPHSKRWCSIGIDGSFLTHLLFFIGVAEDDDLAVAGRPETTAVEVTEESSDESSSHDVSGMMFSSSSEVRSTTVILSEGWPYSNTSE
jgi:hypothetical protein